MPTETYAYRVRDGGGSVRTGTLEGDSLSLVIARLREMGYTPLSVDRKSTTGLQTEVKLPWLGSRIKAEALATFTRQFATMIESGITLLRAVSVLSEQTESTALAEILRAVRMDIEQGSSLSVALSRHPKAFPPIYVSMVRAGEVGGGLDQVLVRVADTLEKQVALQRKIRSAMAYPVGVLCLVLLILTAMLLFVVPSFKTMYSSLGGKLPLPTRLLLSLSNAAVIVIPLGVVSGAVGAYFLRRWIQTPRGRLIWDKLKLRAPLFGKLVHKTALARMGRTMSSLTRSGVPLLEALEVSKETCGNAVLAGALSDVQDGVRKGDSIARRLSEHAIIPPMVTQMVSVGEESGAVDTMLDKIAAFYESQVEATVNTLTSLLEPILVVVLGGIVGGMVVSLYMPMFNLLNTPGLTG